MAIEQYLRITHPLADGAETPSFPVLTKFNDPQDAAFGARVLESGLVSEEELASFLQSVNIGPLPEFRLGCRLADELVSRKRLTQYQVDAIEAGNGRGLTLGNYQILDCLGEGGTGGVFVAQHNRMKRQVALKVLSPRLTGREESLQRFYLEAEAAARLDHENIAAAYDADEEFGRHYLAMEYVDGPELGNWVDSHGPLPIKRAVSLIRQTALGLAHAHRQGIVHRDVKPSNLMLNSHGVLKIVDMGLAHLKAEGADEPALQTQDDADLQGTVDYMAPEQALYSNQIDHRADIYSLGCTMYFLLTGRPPAPEGPMVQKLLWHQSSPPPQLTKDCPAATEELNAIFQKMMAKQPSERQESMVALLNELDQLVL